MQNTITIEQLRKDYQFLLSRFSHEIRNPLTLVISELQLLSSSHPEISTYSEWDDIVENLEYTKDLLNELSAFNDADHIRPKSALLSDYFNSIVSSILPSMKYLEIDLIADISPDLPVRSIDCVKMRQALLNLLRNAQEAITHDHGQILFQAYQEVNKVIIRIQDNGCGISPEFLPDLFTPFITTKSTGTGLGLSVTKQIIEAHNGSLDVKSVPDQGTLFQITF